ncbi:hypothetical protein EZS27_003884 [termite gut metagenome]|uniref:Uncharacterized protein n=1 Tax=termite gut metagenome TaxID=433724 RepID=A0A5J4STB4_9ZZZZ
MPNTWLNSCGGNQPLNTGSSRCNEEIGKIKGLILVESGVKLPAQITPETLEAFFHADTPNRGYPIAVLVEYAPSGGEVQTSQQGYGANRVTGYSAFTGTFTLDKYDIALKANLAGSKGRAFDVYLINENDKIFGERGVDASFKGIPLSSIAVGGQDYETSSDGTSLTISLNYSDIEKHWKNADMIGADFDIVACLIGLRFVVFVPVEGESGKYKLQQTYNHIDITGEYGALLETKGTTVFSSGTAVTYSTDEQTLSITGNPVLKSPSVLQTNGITGIEQDYLLQQQYTPSGNAVPPKRKTEKPVI